MLEHLPLNRQRRNTKQGNVFASSQQLLVVARGVSWYNVLL
jgi:hypothetical protein